jgi:DNA-binding SARP family transcriptional activator
VEYRVLGALEVVDEGRPLSVHGSKQRALLTMLLLNANQAVSTDRLIEALWPGEPPGSGANALQARVSQLRKTLGRHASNLETTPAGYLLRVHEASSDLRRFERLADEAEAARPETAATKLREALSLWRGPALADFRYEEFAQAAIARLDEMRLVALEKRISADLELGRHARVVGELEGLIREHPLRERLRAQLMLALYRTGRQAEALEAYIATRHALMEELGIEPGRPLQDLQQAILRHDPQLDLDEPPAPERSLLVAAQSADSLDALIMVGELLAKKPTKELIIARPISDSSRLSETASMLSERRTQLLARNVLARTAAFVSVATGQDLVRVATDHDVDLVLVDASPQLLDILHTRKQLKRFTSLCQVITATLTAGSTTSPNPTRSPRRSSTPGAG